MIVSVLTSKQSWFVPYAKKFAKKIKGHFYYDHRKIPPSDVVFILSYFKVIPAGYLKKHRHNLVVHESDLPKGRGWAPLFWQVLEGKNKIPVVLFEVNKGLDSGPIYFEDTIVLNGFELYGEIRKKQAEKTIELCKRFLKERPISRHQKNIRASYYPKRTVKDSQINIDKTIREQFDLLRIVNNEEFPAFFYCKGHKYILKIFKCDK